MRKGDYGAAGRRQASAAGEDAGRRRAGILDDVGKMSASDAVDEAVLEEIAGLVAPRCAALTRGAAP